MSLPQTVVDYLLANYKPKAILLHGSRARGDASDGSDYDITLLPADTSARPHIYDGLMLDLSSEPADMAVLTSSNVPIWPIDVLYDSDGAGAAVAARTKKAFEVGPAALSEVVIENRKNFVRRYYARLLVRQDDSALRLYYLGLLVERFIRYYFEMQQRWTQSYHVMTKTIAIENPTYKAHLDVLASDDYIKSIAWLYKSLFGEDINK